MEKKRKWSVEYSVSQDCFHVDRLDKTLNNNCETMVSKMSNDYKIIAICDTQEEANKFVNVLRKMLEVR